jgi:apolipoprotein N-acyltransferase
VRKWANAKTGYGAIELELLKNKILKFVLSTIASVLSGLLLALTLPKSNLSFLAWFGLVPLIIVICRSHSSLSFLYSLICGAIFYGFTFSWMLEISDYGFLHHALLHLYLGCYVGLSGLATSIVSRRLRIAPALLAMPFIWVSLEYIRSNAGFLAYPTSLLGHSQYTYPRIIQISSLTGAYGVSLLILLANSAISAGILWLCAYSRKIHMPANRYVSKQEAGAVIGLVITLMALCFSYGHIVVTEPISGNKIKLAVVQGNIDQESKWDVNKAKFIMNTYARLTHEALRERPSLIIWPETATPGSISRNPILYMWVKRIAERTASDLLIGSGSHEKFKLEGQTKTKFHNSAFHIHKDRNTKDRYYDKIRLVPFGEYLPLRGIVPWSRFGLPDVVDYLPGEEFTVFEGPGFRFSAAICWETIFPDLIRGFVKNGAQVIINLTNEAWFGKTAAPYQFLAISVFRAVENRVYLVRCGNTGISCFINPYGEISDRVKDATGQDIFIQGVLTSSVVPMDSETIYTNFGDWLAWLCIICSASFLFVAFLKKKTSLKI